MAAVIAPVTDEEHKELARLVLRAFSSSLFHQRIFGKVDSATHVQFLAVQARSALQDPRCKMVKATRDGKMVGFARWTTPKDADTHAEQKAGNATSIWSQDGHYPPGSEINLAKELLEVPEKELLEPHFRIDMLAVDPGVQGARVGSTLLRHVCRQADDLGVAVYLRASPGDQVLGFVWSVRQPAAKDWPPVTSTQQEYPIPAGFDPVRKRDFDAMLMRHAQSIPFMRWTLLAVSVDPAAQGAGVGKRLVHSVIKQAASEGLPVVLEAEEERIPMYLSGGFELFGDALVAAEDSTVRLWPMVLKTRKASTDLESAQT
ncbi:hypothetical protein JCM8115_006506 [Rhodotorula mucilaginosa]